MSYSPYPLTPHFLASVCASMGVIIIFFKYQVKQKTCDQKYILYKTLLSSKVENVNFLFSVKIAHHILYYIVLCKLGPV